MRFPYIKELTAWPNTPAGTFNIHNDFEEVKAIIVEDHPDADFMNGQCMLFHLELTRYFKDCICFLSNDHVVSLIGGSLWDFTGVLFWSKNDEPKILNNYKIRTEKFLFEERFKNVHSYTSTS